MFEHAVYSVISPEGLCVDPVAHVGQGRRCRAAMKMSAQDLLGLKVIDRIVTEPVGGAHRAPEVAIAALGDAIEQEFDALVGPAARYVARRARRKIPGDGARLAAVQRNPFAGRRVPNFESASRSSSSGLPCDAMTIFADRKR
jgi:hypothetical protein